MAERNLSIRLSVARVGDEFFKLSQKTTSLSSPLPVPATSPQPLLVKTRIFRAIMPIDEHTPLCVQMARRHNRAVACPPTSMAACKPRAPFA
jgi:hypothetical protein